MFSHFKSSMFQDNTPNELCHLEGPWDVKLLTFEFVLFYLFPHLTLEGKRDFSSRFGFLFKYQIEIIYGREYNRIYLIQYTIHFENNDHIKIHNCKEFLPAMIVGNKIKSCVRKRFYVISLRRFKFFGALYKAYSRKS